MGGQGGWPTPEEIEAARLCVGMRQVELNAADRTVRFAREGVMLDLGAIGKGYAIEQAAEVLREARVSSALIHGGTSTVYGLGKPPEGDGWKVAIHHPDPESEEPLTTVVLRDEALSVSAVWGRSFEHNGKTFGHVLDPRTGYPVSGAVLSAVIHVSATETDALSTALLTLGAEGKQAIGELRPHMRTLLVHRQNETFRMESLGIAV
jgi:thiamine biosynthesis lipoprotein